MPGIQLRSGFVGLVHEIFEFIGFGWLHRPVSDVKYANRLGLVMNGEVDLIAAIALAVKENANIRLKILGFLRERATSWQFTQRPNRINNPIEPPLSALEASSLPDMPCNCVNVCQRLR